MDERKRIYEKKKDDRKTENLSVRVTQETKERIKQNSIDSGMTQSEFITKCIEEGNFNVIPDGHQIAKLLHLTHKEISDLSRIANDIDATELSNSISKLVILLDENTHNIKKGR